MVRIFFSVLLISLFSQALPQYFNMLKSQIPGGNPPHRCMNCHVSTTTPALNLFGKDYHSIFIAPNPLKIPGIQIMTFSQKWDLLLNKMDSNKNGDSNFLDIVNGKNPGVAQ